MNPEIARSIATQHHEELRLLMTQSRRAFHRRWHVSWSRAVLSADATHRRGSSLVIIISARRPA